MSWLFVAGTVLTVAGTGMGIAADSETNSAIHKARDAEQARQLALTEQRQKTFDASVAQSGTMPASRSLSAGADRREAAYSTLAGAPQGAVAPVNDTRATVSGPTSTANESSKAATNAWSALTGGAQARLGSYADWTQGQDIKNLHASQDLSLNANKAKGSLGVSQFEIEHASHAGDNLRDWGKVASALGSIGMMAGGVANAGTATAANAGPTTAQTAAMSAGYGPVSAGYAASIAPTTGSAWQNAGIFANVPLGP